MSYPILVHVHKRYFIQGTELHSSLTVNGARRGSHATSTLMLESSADAKMFTKVGYYKGQLVAVKRIYKAYIHATKEIVEEVNNVSK